MQQRGSMWNSQPYMPSFMPQFGGGFQQQQFQSRGPQQFTTSLHGKKLHGGTCADLRLAAQFERIPVDESNSALVALCYEPEWDGLHELCKQWQVFPSWHCASSNTEEDFARLLDIQKVCNLRWSRSVHRQWLAMNLNFIAVNNLDPPKDILTILHRRRKAAKLCQRKTLKKKLDEMRRDSKCPVSDSEEEEIEDISSLSEDDQMYAGNTGNKAAASNDNPAQPKRRAKVRSREESENVEDIMIGLPLKMPHADGKNHRYAIIASAEKSLDGVYTFTVNYEDDNSMVTMTVAEIESKLMLPAKVVKQKLDKLRTVSIATPPPTKKDFKKRVGQILKVPSFVLPNSDKDS